MRSKLFLMYIFVIKQLANLSNLCKKKSPEFFVMPKYKLNLIKLRLKEVAESVNMTTTTVEKNVMFALALIQFPYCVIFCAFCTACPVQCSV